MATTPTINQIWPAAGITNGEIFISCQDFDTADFRSCKVLFGTTKGRIISASTNRIIVAVPDLTKATDRNQGIHLSVNGVESNTVAFSGGERLAENLHPVANPAFDSETGNTYATLSGSRGQKVPVSIWKIDSTGNMSPFISDLINPTSLAFDEEGTMFVSSRNDGTIYRISPFREAEVFARNLGVATGIAFDKHGDLYVGDRQGTIYKVNKEGHSTEFAHLEPSVSAYHLAFGMDEHLYVTGPTASSYESVYRIGSSGEVAKYYTGLGRPQGLAFDNKGNLYVAASLNGHRGVVKIDQNRQAELCLAGSAIVGLAFDDAGNMLVATTKEIYRVQVGLKGLLQSTT